MPTPVPPLLQYEKNVRSQAGEDGVIAHALGLLPERDKWCVEFGAWDGIYCSNTNSLIEGQDYSAVLIEADRAKWNGLRETFRSRKNVYPLCRFVEFEGANTLNNILAETPIPAGFDVLSIDIDGNDYHIWDSLKKYRPKLVVIEFNPSMPNEIDFVQPRDMRISQGSSLRALDKLAKSKGYRLIHATLMNGIFVDEKYFPLFGIAENDPAQFRANLSGVTRIFQTFDGKIHLTGNREMLWHNGIFMSEHRIQTIPPFLRATAANYNQFQKCAWKIFRLWRKITGP